MARKDLGKIICEITDVNATVDNGVGIPSASATITGTLTEKTINFDFKNLKGDKPVKGVDYLTPAEKEEFTNDTKAIIQAEGTKVVEQVKNIVAGNPAESNALTLSGKTRTEFEQDVENAKTELQENVTNFESTRANNKNLIPFKLIKAGINQADGALNLAEIYRVSMSDIALAETDIDFYCSKDHLIKLFLYNSNENLLSAGGNVTYFRVLKGQYYRIVIIDTNKDNPNYTADINTMRLNVTYEVESETDVKITGNLYRDDLLVRGYLINNNGELIKNINYFSTDFIKINPNTDYSFKNYNKTGIGFAYAARYDENKKFLSRVDLTTKDYFTTPYNCYYIRFVGKLEKGFDGIYLIEGKTVPNIIKPFALENRGHKMAKLPNNYNEMRWFRHNDRIAPHFEPYMLSQDIEKEFPIEGTEFNAQKIYSLYDSLMRKFSNYISKKEIGKASDQQPIYAYTFASEPNSPLVERDCRQKAILISGVHNERYGIYCLYRALRVICENWKSDSKLAKLRLGVKFIVVPCINTYGITTGAWAGGRTNANKVDIARNFPLEWSHIPYVEGEENAEYSGEEPLSEPESKAIDNLMKNNLDIDYFTSFHNYFGGNPNSSWCTSSMDSVKQLALEHIISMSAEYYKKGYTPKSGDYFGKVDMNARGGSEGMYPMQYGIRSCTFEVASYDLSEKFGSSQAITMGTEMIINWLLINYYANMNLIN